MAAEGMIIDFGASDTTDDSTPFSSPIKGNYVDFFWGSGCRGFEVLLNNFKSHVTASHQMGEYLKDRVLIEKSYVKSLRKLSKTLNSTPDSNFGGLYPVWLVLLRTLDQVCIRKDRQVNALHELCKTILEYSSKQDDHMKSNTKGDIDSAQKSLTTYRASLVSVRKSHKAYEQSCREVVQHEGEAERLKADPLKEQELKKAEHKLKKLKTHMEHMKSEHQREIDGCNDKLNDYEDKMTKACQKFQSLEEDHLKTMREYMAKLADIHQSCDISMYKEYKQLSEKLDAFPVDKLISMFSQIKGTGKIKPEAIKFAPIQEEVIKLSRKGSLGGPDDVSTATTTDDTLKQKGARRGLFVKDKKRKKKKKEGKTVVSKERSSTDVRAATPTNNDKEESYEVDEEGYRIRPKDADKIAKFSDEESSNDDDDSDFDDSDSDNEPEKRIKNIKIKMKDDTTSNDTMSVDELNQAAKTLKLDPLPSLTGLKASIKRSGSSQSLNTSLGTSQFNRANISADTRSLHDPLDNAINDSHGDTPSPTVSLPPPSVDLDVTIPPLIPTASSTMTTPIPDVSSLSSLPLWDISTSSDVPTATPSQNWATFSSDFSGSGLSTPEINKRVDQPNKSMDFGILGGNGVNNSSKDEFSKLNKTVPAIVPTKTPPPSNPNPTGSLLLPPPSKSMSGPRRRGTTDTSVTPSGADGSTSSLDFPSMSRLPNTSSIGSTSAPPLSPLMNSQKVRRESSPNLSSNKLTTPITNKGSGVVIPFAIAFQEHCHAIYKGTDQSKAIVKVTGNMDFSFPASCISQLESCEPLKFRLMNVSMVNKILHNENILKREDEHTYVFIMDKLHGQLKELEKTKGSPFCNVQGLRYEVNCSASSFPFLVSVVWKCDQTTTTFKLDYSYNSSVFPFAVKPTLTNGTVRVTIDGGVTQHSLEPLGVWQGDKKLAGWKMGPLFPEKNPITGSLEGKFTVSSGPTPPTPAIIHFLCDGSTLSGISMTTLTTNNYKVSLVKNKCLAGKFIAEPM